MGREEINVGEKVLVEVEIRRLAGDNVHIMIGNKVVSVPISILK
ncbi:hypothetical protein [Bacillus cereus]|nr:hypothetical protein [Bacillus cereus]